MTTVRDYSLCFTWQPANPEARTRKAVLRVKAGSTFTAIIVAIQKMSIERTIPTNAAIKSVRLQAASL